MKLHPHIQEQMQPTIEAALRCAKQRFEGMVLAVGESSEAYDLYWFKQGIEDHHLEWLWGTPKEAQGRDEHG
jgi:hypothetical protein